MAQIGLQFGADDLGSILIEENVVRSAGCDQEIETMNDLPQEIARMAAVIREAGLAPYERDTFYQVIARSEATRQSSG